MVDMALCVSFDRCKNNIDCDRDPKKGQGNDYQSWILCCNSYEVKDGINEDRQQDSECTCKEA